MKTEDQNASQKLSDCSWEAHLLSRMLLAWGMLFEELEPFSENLRELEGLGMALREYSCRLAYVSKVLDELDMELHQEKEPAMKKTKKTRRD